MRCEWHSAHTMGLHHPLLACLQNMLERVLEPSGADLEGVWGSGEEREVLLYDWNGRGG